MNLCVAHSMPHCRLCTRHEKPAFGTGPRKPLAQKKQRQARMSRDAEVEPALAGRCMLLGFTDGDCSGHIQRCHIVPQELLRETYRLGAWRGLGDEFWRPVTRDTIFPASGAENITLQQILDDRRNLVSGCERHNCDGLVMVNALDARMVAGLAAYPAGFGEFCHSFRFAIDGTTYWYHVPFESGGA